MFNIKFVMKSETRKTEIFTEIRFFKNSTKLKTIKNIKSDSGKEFATDEFSYKIFFTERKSSACKDIKVTLKITKGQTPEINFCLGFDYLNWSPDNYLVLPGAVYAANRFDSVDWDYGVKPTQQKYLGLNAKPLIADIPRLGKDKSFSRIQQLAGDLATPAFGVYDLNKNSGIWIFGPSHNKYGQYGYEVREDLTSSKASFTIMTPGIREDKIYKMRSFKKISPDRGIKLSAGDEIRIQCKIQIKETKSINQLFENFILNRKCMANNQTIENQLPFSEAFKILNEKFNRDNWYSEHKFYGVLTKEFPSSDIWQLGWVGGLQSALPLLNATENAKRCFKTIDHALLKCKSPNDLYYPVYDKNGNFKSDYHKYNSTDFPWILSRRIGDTMLTAIKIFNLLNNQNPKKVKSDWEQSIKKCADSILKFWDKFDQVGQYISYEELKIGIGGTTSSASIPAGLVYAARYFQKTEYLKTAKEMAESLYKKFVCKGYTNSGPADALNSPDSESCFALLESLIEIYEYTKNKKFLKMACDTANQASSWCMSYNFKFTTDSTFGKLNMQTLGTVFANVQNKHSAPGICTNSGLSLLKLYRATNKKDYLELLKDISKSLPQYISRKDRPINYVNPETGETKPLPSGWMNERVNTSDWLEPIGEIFYASCWPEVTTMLTAIELPGIYIDTVQKIVKVFDHIELQEFVFKEKAVSLKLYNETNFGAEVTVFVDNDKSINLEKNKPFNFYKLKIPAHTEKWTKIKTY